MDEVIGGRGEGNRRPVGEMPAVIEGQGKDLVPRLDQSVICREVGLGSGMGLDIDVSHPEKFLGSLHREVLHRIHVLASAIVTMGGIPFRVFGHENRRGGLPNVDRRIVFGGDQLDAPVLPFFLFPEIGLDFFV